MKVIITGRGKSGSWKIRGDQLGQAIGATIAPRYNNFDGYDRVIAVKRLNDEFLQAVRKSGRPWIWDIVDAYPQPESRSWSEYQAISWLQKAVERAKPRAMVFPTTQMKVDSKFQGPCLVLPHHAWLKYSRQAIRPEVQKIGYEGGEQYLGKWGPKIIKVCADRNWQFIVNGDLTECDIGVALRDPLSYADKNWKSNVKIANLQALGLPILCTSEASYKEFASGGEFMIHEDFCDSIGAVLHHMSNYDIRKDIHDIAPDPRFALETVAEEYKRWLLALRF